MNPERRPVPGWEDKYEASEDGHIYSVDRMIARKNGSSILCQGRRRKLTTNEKGYGTLILSGNGVKRHYRAHRLIAAAFGLIDITDPSEIVDHIDHDRQNNRVSNLRKATTSENHAYGGKLPRKNNTSGYRGVSWHRQRGKWTAWISDRGAGKYLGIFNCKEDAALAYDRAAREIYGDFAFQNFSQKEDAA